MTGNLGENTPDSEIRERIIHPTIICTDSDVGEEFFNPLQRAYIVSLETTRSSNGYDLVTFTTDRGETVITLVKQGNIIAIERKAVDKQKSGILAFSDNIAHTRFNIALNATYFDTSLPKGERVQAKQDCSLLLTDGVKVDTIKPTWWTEDWLTISGPIDPEAATFDHDSLVLRAKSDSILGAVVVTQDDIRVLHIPLNNTNPEHMLTAVSEQQY